jgi:hypothetical protein
MEPYNHEARGIFDACGIDEQNFKERIEGKNMLQYFPLFNERELALMLSNDVVGMFNDDKTAIMCFARPHTRIKQFAINRVKKHYDVESIVENLDLLSEDIRINKFAAWHTWIVLCYGLIRRRSYAVKFIEETYSKSEIYILLLFKHRMKIEVMQSEEGNLAKMLEILAKTASNDGIALAPIDFNGKVEKDEKYDILKIQDDFTDRMIVQNDPTHRLLYSTANSIAQIYGVSEESVSEIKKEAKNVKKFIHTVSNLKLTDTERAVLYSAAIDSFEIESMCCNIQVTMPSLLSYYQHTDKKKRIWCDEIFAYDSVERVQWFIDNNITLEDIEHIARIYHPEYEYL